MSRVRPYYQILIHDLGEALVEIPLDKLAIIFPHAYHQVGATYSNYSPYRLRQGVVHYYLLLALKTRLVLGTHQDKHAPLIYHIKALSKSCL